MINRKIAYYTLSSEEVHECLHGLGLIEGILYYRQHLRGLRMTEVTISMQQMYEAEKQQKEKKDYSINYGIGVAAIVVVGIGMLMPSPANWYVWIVGFLGIGVLRELL